MIKVIFYPTISGREEKGNKATGLPGTTELVIRVLTTAGG
jgi:hypothetical protein